MNSELDWASSSTSGRTYTVWTIQIWNSTGPYGRSLSCSSTNDGTRPGDDSNNTGPRMSSDLGSGDSSLWTQGAPTTSRPRVSDHDFHRLMTS